MIFYPPKPTLISKDQPLFERLEHDGDTVAEPKYNGTRLILQFNGTIEFWNRHGTKLKYDPSPEVVQALEKIRQNLKGFTVFDGELVHSKTKTVKHKVVLWDIFMLNGTPVGSQPFVERRKILERLVNGWPLVVGGSKLCGLAPQWNSDFKRHYEELIQHDEIEGLVIKKLGAKLVLGTRESPTVSYMFKVRKPGPNYRF